jgi:AbrB family looped-hinge helix DNA binding protein
MTVMVRSLPATYRVKIDRQGRLVIPVAVREALGIGPDEPLLLTVEGNELRVRSVQAAIERAQQITARYTAGRTGLVDEFIAERRREAERE